MFEAAIEKDASEGDAHTGCGWAQVRMGDLQSSRGAFQRAHPHDDTVNWRDMRLIVAICRFAQADYAEANREIGRLGGAPAG